MVGGAALVQAGEAGEEVGDVLQGLAVGSDREGEAVSVLAVLAGVVARLDHGLRRNRPRIARCRPRLFVRGAASAGIAGRDVLPATSRPRSRSCLLAGGR